MWRYVATILIAMTQMPVAAVAEPSVNEFLKLYDSAKPDGRVIFELAIRHTFEGIAWVNAYLHRTNQELYCAPSQIALLDAQLIDMLRRESKAFPENGKAPYGLALLLVSIKSFPCKNSN
jgi:hypothetical protein